MGLKIIVTGGRDFHDYRYIHAVLYEIDQQVGIDVVRVANPDKGEQ